MNSEEESLSGQRLLKDHSWRIVERGWVSGSENLKKKKNGQTAPTLVLCSKYRYDDVSSQRFDYTSIDTAGPVACVQQCGPRLIWIQEHRLKCLTTMFNLTAEEHNWVAWYKETESPK